MVQLAASADVAKYQWNQSVVTGDTTIQVEGNKGAQVFNFANGAKSSAMRDMINASTDMTGVSATLSTDHTLVLRSVGYGSSQYVSVKTVADPSHTFIVATHLGKDADIRINGVKATTDGLNASVRAGGLDLGLTVTTDFGTGKVASKTALFDITGGGALFQIGSDVTPMGQYRMGIQSVATTSLGDTTNGRLSQIGRDGAYSLTGGKSQEAQAIVDVAIQQVSTLRGRLGGFQKNQLQTNINSQQVALENAQASESAIRDADYATETSNMTRAQILVQSTTQILAIANQQPQNVLTLLKGG